MDVIELAKKCNVEVAGMPHYDKQLQAFANAVLEEAAKTLDKRYEECLEPEIREAAAAIRAMKKEM